MRIGIGYVTRFACPTRSIGINSITAPLEESIPSKSAGISPDPTSSDLHGSCVAPYGDGIGKIGDAIVTLTKLVWYRVVNLTASSLGPVIFSPPDTKLHFRLSSPTGTAEGSEAIVKYDPGSSSYPYVLIDIGEAGVSSGASGVRERK